MSVGTQPVGQMRKALLPVITVAALAFTAGAQGVGPATAPDAPKMLELETVTVVAGVQTGPSLWKVSKGEHLLWILGTVAPVPKRMEWVSPQADAALASAQELIGAPGFAANMGVGSMFKAAFAMPTIMKARRNPGDKTLREVLPADLYARWLPLKALYLGDDDAVEKWRPIFAAGELYQAALKRTGLEFGNGTDKRIDDLADKYKLKRTPTVIRTEIKDPKGLAKSFARADVDDVACFRSLLDRLEVDVASAAEMANAWAVGDIPELARLSRRVSVTPCYEAMARTEAMRSLGADNAKERSRVLWLQAVDAALGNNPVTFATLPVSELLEPDGLLTRLQSKGYVIEAPE